LPDFEAIYGFNKFIEKGEFYDFGRDRAKGTESIFSAKTDVHHREKRRKVFGPALSNTKIIGYEPVIKKNVGILLSRLELSLRQDDSASKPVNVAGLVHRYTIDTMLEVLYGPTICSQPCTDASTTRDLPRVLRDMTRMAWSSSLLPWFGWLANTRPAVALLRRPTRNAKGEPTNISALAIASQSLIFSHQEQLVQSKEMSILKNWVEVPVDDSKKMAPSELWTEAFNLTLAGPGSTAAAITAVLYMLGLPEGREWQEMIRLEVKGVEIKAASASSFPVVFAIIKETLRLHPPFPTAFPRTIMPSAENVIPNLPVALPVGTVVSANTFVLGRSKKIWGEDANEWKPQRWLGSEYEKQQMEDKFVVFSKGSRQCVGKELAMLTLAKAVASVAQRWEFKSVGELKGNSFLEMAYDECWISFKDLPHSLNAHDAQQSSQ
jgi:cytochrome P450